MSEESKKKVVMVRQEWIYGGLFLLLVLFLVKYGGSTQIEGNQTATPSPSPTAADNLGKLGVEEIFEIALKTPALNTGEEIDPGWCDGDLTIQFSKFVDVNHDGSLDRLVDLGCNSERYYYSNPHLIVVLTSRGEDGYAPLLTYPFGSDWSEIEVVDLEQDGMPEIRIGKSFFRGGSGMAHNYWEYIYIACEEECKIIWNFRPFYRLWTRTYENGRDALMVSPEVLSVSTWEMVNYHGRAAILVTTNEATFYESTFLPPGASPHSVYDIEIAAPIKKLYLKNDGIFSFERAWREGERQRIAPQMPYMEFMGRFAAKGTYFRGTAPSEDTVGNFIDQEGFGHEPVRAGIPDIESFIYEGLARLERYQESGGEYYRCELSIYINMDKWEEFEKRAAVDLPCAPNLTDLQVRSLGGLTDATEYILVFTVDFHLVSPIHRLTVFKWDGEEIVKVDEIEGRLHVSGMDGVVLTCETYSPCSLRVRKWDFDKIYSESVDVFPPEPTYIDLIWDAEQERFIKPGQ